MLLERYGDGDEPAALAWAQCLLALAILRTEDRNATALLVDSPDQVVYWSADHSTWPCDCLAVEQSAGVYFVHLYGTTNIAQWADNLTGAPGQEWEPGIGTVHAGFVRQAEAVASNLRGLAERPGHAPVYVGLAGHSLGGATAILLAALVRLAYPAARVEFLTMGAPRVLTRGLPPPARPHAGWAVQAAGDVVPQLPPVATQWVYLPDALPFGLGGTWAPVPVRYLTYGTVLTLWPDGQVGPSGTTTYPLGDGVAVGDLVAVHLLRDYWGRARLHLINAGAPVALALSTARLALDARDAGYDFQALAEVAWARTGAVAPPPGPPVVGALPVRVFPMADNTLNLLDSGVGFRVTLLLEWGDVGWSENYYAYVAGNPPVTPGQLDAVTAWSDALVQARRVIMANVVGITGVRIRQESAGIVAPTLPIGYANATGLRAGSSNVNLGALIKWSSPNRVANRFSSLRGFRQDDMASLGLKPLDTYPFVPSFDSAMTSFKTFCMMAAQNYAGVNVQMALLKTTAGLGPVIPVSVTTNNLGYLVVTMNSAVAINPNVPLQLKSRKKRCQSGIAGTFSIQAVDPDPASGTVAYTLSGQVKCSVDPNVSVSVLQKVPTFYGVGGVFVRRQTTHKSGRPFGLLVGRQKGKA